MKQPLDPEKSVALLILSLVTLAMLIILVYDMTVRADQMVPNLVTTLLGVSLGWSVHKVGGVLPFIDQSGKVNSEVPPKNEQP